MVKCSQCFQFLQLSKQGGDSLEAAGEWSSLEHNGLRVGEQEPESSRVWSSTGRQTLNETGKARGRIKPVLISRLKN